MKRDREPDNLVNCSVESPAGFFSIKNCDVENDLRKTVAKANIIPNLKSEMKSGAHTINATSFELFDKSAEDNANIYGKGKIRYRPTTAAH